jgi:hypothetical protein
VDSSRESYDEHTQKEEQIKKRVVSKLLYGPLSAMTSSSERAVKAFGMSWRIEYQMGYWAQRRGYRFSSTGSYKKIFPALFYMGRIAIEV